MRCCNCDREEVVEMWNETESTGSGKIVTETVTYGCPRCHVSFKVEQGAYHPPEKPIEEEVEYKSDWVDMAEKLKEGEHGNV